MEAAQDEHHDRSKGNQAGTPHPGEPFSSLLLFHSLSSSLLLAEVAAVCAVQSLYSMVSVRRTLIIVTVFLSSAEPVLVSPAGPPSPSPPVVPT